MSEAEIQAIVGFIRSWEATAPEVAEPARGGGSPWWQSGSGQTPGGRGGGPPWLRSDSTSSNSSSLPSGGNIQPAKTDILTTLTGTNLNTHSYQNSQNRPPWMQTAQDQSTSWWQALDWRVVALVSGGLLAAMILVVIGLVGLRHLGSIQQ